MQYIVFITQSKNRKPLEGTATATGKHFFQAWVENLAITLKTHSAWVTEYVAETRQLHALAFWSEGDLYNNFFIAVDGTLCEKVIESSEIVHFSSDILFPLFSHHLEYPPGWFLVISV